MRTDELLERWPDAERILDALLDLAPEERRAQALSACGDDATLAAVVQQLLGEGGADEPAPAIPVGLLSEPDRDGSVPTAIGPYRVLGEIGQGDGGAMGLRRGLDVARRRRRLAEGGHRRERHARDSRDPRQTAGLGMCECHRCPHDHDDVAPRDRG